MRVALDTNILISALLSPGGKPAAIYNAWESGRYTLLTCPDQLEELRAALLKPRLAGLIKPYNASRLANQIRQLAETIDELPTVRRSPDPADDFILALCEAGRADFLVTGDKSGLLSLSSHRSTRIVTARAFAEIID